MRGAMNLTVQILFIILQMQPTFAQARSFRQFGYMIFAILCTAGRHTITSFIFFGNKDRDDWTKFYRFFSKKKWKPNSCFDKITEIAIKEAFEENDDFIIALDDFRVRKTGKTIPHARYQLDPKSPPFHPNLMWGHRYLHATLLIIGKKNGERQAARAISIRIELTPHIQKPGKKASKGDWEIYESNKKDFNLCQYASRLIQELRKLFDQLGYSHKIIAIVADGGYCNKTIFQNLPDRVKLIVRCRKDAKLCKKSLKKRKFYDDKKFTPYDIYKDPEISSKEAEIFYGRKNIKLKYKEESEVYWQRGAKKCPLKAIIVHGVKYRRNKNGYENYREPMYLLTMDLGSHTKNLIQYYLYRWEIEVTHRELKNDLGISQAQVTNEISVGRCPKTIGIANSLIKLAHILLEKEGKNEIYAMPPKWYKDRKRISLAYMRRRLRTEMTSNLHSSISWRSLFEKIAA
jgi:DDE superfamily endonuclease